MQIASDSKITLTSKRDSNESVDRRVWRNLSFHCRSDLRFTVTLNLRAFTARRLPRGARLRSLVFQYSDTKPRHTNLS